MKSIYCFLLVVFPFFLIAQENESRLDSLTNHALDSIKKAEKKLYIQDHTKQLNIKFELSNDITEYEIPFNNDIVDVSPNLGIRYALVFSYKFLTIRLGIRPNKSSSSVDNKGESDSFRLRLQLHFDNWIHKFEYNRVEGYYISNSSNLIEENPDYFVQLPDLETHLFSGTSNYKFNKNYSIRSVETQTEIQKKSVGSLMAGVQYFYYKINGTGNYIDGNGNPGQKSDYLSSSGIDFLLNVGYHYNFIFKKWYANLGVVGGAGIDINETTLYSELENTNINSTNFIYSLKGNAGIGYNLRKFFFGVTAEYKLIHQKQNENKLHFNTDKNSFFVFVGYRFKTPKRIAKPIDNIEEKIPMLKND